MSKDYIPGNNDKFFNFQNYLSSEVSNNFSAWNIPEEEKDALITWNGGYGNVHKSIINIETRTREDIVAHNNYKTDYVVFLRALCQGYLVNNPLIPISERVAMGLNPRGVNPRSERPAITTSPFVELKPLGGGMVRFGFRVESSSKRTGRQPDSNGVEVFYKVLAQGPKAEAMVVLEDSLDTETAKATDSGLPADGYLNMFSSRARFIHQLNMGEIGKTLHVYARWVNTSDATKNGPYSMVSTTVIS